MERTDNAVELWAEEFSKKPIRPLTKEEMSGLMGWSMVKSSESFNDNELKQIIEDKKGGLAYVFLSYKDRLWNCWLVGGRS